MGFGFEDGFRISGLGRGLGIRLRGGGSQLLIKVGNPLDYEKDLQGRYTLI